MATCSVKGLRHSTHPHSIFWRLHLVSWPAPRRILFSLTTVRYLPSIKRLQSKQVASERSRPFNCQRDFFREYWTPIYQTTLQMNVNVYR